MKNKIGFGMLILAILLVSMTLIPAVSAQQDKDYYVTAKEAFKHANAHMISFIAADVPGFENWTGASIDTKPLELYDISGQKLFYQFSVYKENEVIGTIDVCAEKTLGPSIYDIKFDPEPYNVDEAMKKAKEIANTRYPDGKIKSTVMVVYSYPKVGAMTTIKDKATGEEYRIFVDAYSLEEVQDNPINETRLGDLGVWSLSETMLKNDLEDNLKAWQESDNFTKSIEQMLTDEGFNTNATLTEQDIIKISSDATIKTVTSKTLSVPAYTQETDYYCVPASIKMLCEYFNDPTIPPTQTYIFTYLDGLEDYGLSSEDICEWVEDVWDKTPTVRTSGLYNIDIVTEIDNNRPFFSMIPWHCRVCRGYLNSGYFYEYINDPLTGSAAYECTYGGPETKRIYVR
jgi:hypothetical protein